MGLASDEEFLDSDMETDDDDSQEDPSFDIIQQHTQSKLSKLSITTSRCIPPDDDDDCIETEANHQKSYEFVQNMIQAGQVEKLKVEQCKLYLRKHGLRLSGKKDVLIHRINDHISIKNGEGEHQYPASSFVMNCKGDSCTGDIVMFEQNVYEMFNVASKSATGPPCGTRVVAGRIVKESYGAAKQQHTFTIEVLWSKGEKPLPPLHPLLIKGRNLYRLKTMRQRWEDESQRRKILSEKHSRGDAARLNREARLQEKEKKKALRENRASKGNIRIEKDDTMINVENPRKPDLQNISNQHGDAPYKGVLGNCSLKSIRKKERNCSVPPSTGFDCSLKSMTHNNHGGTHKENIIPNDLKSPVRREPHGPFRRSFQVEQNIIHNDFRSPVRGEPNGAFRKSFQAEQSTHFYPSRVFERHDYDHRANIYLTRNPGESYNFHQGNNHHQVPRGRYQGQRQQLCRYYSQGRCHFGTNCKYLH